MEPNSQSVTQVQPEKELEQPLQSQQPDQPQQTEQAELPKQPKSDKKDVPFKIDNTKIEKPALYDFRKNKKVNYAQFFAEGEDESSDAYSITQEKKLNEMSQRKRGRSSKKEKEQENLGDIINIIDCIQKNRYKIVNTDMIKIILEITLNSQKIGITKDNSSRSFWDEVSKLPQFEDIFRLFKGETLRKYWRELRQTKKYKKIIHSLNQYSNLLNAENIKLLSAIKIVCDYVTYPKKSIEYYI